MLIIQNLCFKISGKTLFDSTSVTVPKGHKIGLVGRNGTGKTSLFKLIRNEWSPETGTINIPKNFIVGGVGDFS